LSGIRSTVTTLRTTADRYRAERREMKQLEREIAEYRTDSERQDLYAMLSRHTAEEIAPIERVLTQLARTEGLAFHR
jgi:uncharacterized coiled-coil DUF342 family protein